MKILQEIGVIELNNNWDSHGILQMLIDQGFAICEKPRNDCSFKYGILVEKIFKEK